MAKLILSLLLFSSLSTFAHAQFPDAPAPHKFLDKTNITSLSLMVAARTADTVNTCLVLHSPYGYEQWLPTQSCGGVAGFSLAFSAAGIGSAALLHHWGHHKLERWVMPIATAGAAAGMLMSARNHNFRL